MIQIDDICRIFAPMQPGSFAERRYEICKGCDKFRPQVRQCKECGCVMPVKVRIADATCPFDKWGKESNG